jgi:hypothetical protein
VRHRTDDSLRLHYCEEMRLSLPTLRSCVLAAALAIAACSANAAPADVNPAQALRARFAALGDKLSGSQFSRPLYLDSAESSNSVRGDVYALLDFPFADVNAVFNGPAQWCDVLILHINTKFCAASRPAAGDVLTLHIGKKTEEKLADTSPVEFGYRVLAAKPDYLAVELHADKGPWSTGNFIILLEVAADAGKRSLVHLTYSYGFGATGRLAMQVYLATAGRGKVGFTITGTRPDGRPEYIGGTRGVVERNTMRYFLAIDAYLRGLAAPPAERLEKRLQTWYTGSEEFPQLHDVDRAAYMEMKRHEYSRQQAAQATLAR